MQKYILAIIAALSLTACSTGTDENKITSTINKLTESMSKGAITDYTDIIHKHAQENDANYSFKAVQYCQIKQGGMSEDDLIELIQTNYSMAKKCWNSLVEYPTQDKRFYKEDSIEKEVLKEFLSQEERYSELFLFDTK